MKTYITNGEAKFEIKQTDVEENEKIKVRVTHVMPSGTDVEIFGGESTTEYPFVIGHSAIGVVSDDRPEYGVKRGMKVIIDPYVTEGNERLDWDTQVKTKGVDMDGFMKEFVFMDIEKIIPFPENIDEEEAIFTEQIAVALKVLNSFTIEKGDYMVIIGGNTICNILGQLALYFQLIPIMIDGNEANLERAKQSGIYYTIDETKESAFEKVSEITCGRMAETVVVSIGREQTSPFIFPLTKVGGKCVIVSENKVLKTFETDISAISKKQLRIRGINNGASEFDSAINILAQHILKLDGFIEKTVEIKDAEVLMRDLKKNPELYFNAVIKL